MSTTNQPEVLMTVTAVAGEEVKKFMSQEGVDPKVGGLRVSVQPGGCSGFKYGLLIEDAAAEDDLVVDQGEYRVFVDPYSAQYISGVIIDYTSSMQGSGFNFRIRMRPAAAVAAAPSRHNSVPDMNQPVPENVYASTVWTERNGKWVAVFHQETTAAPPAKK